MEQIDVNGKPHIINANESHMALVFLLDVSGSMDGEPIKSLNKGLKEFKKIASSDDKTASILDVAIISFNSTYIVEQEFTPVGYLNDSNLVANGGTCYVEPIKEAIRMVDERTRFYKRNGTMPYKPWIFLISDGAPFDDISEIAKTINNDVERKKYLFWSLAVKGANLEILHQLSGKRVLEIDDCDFSKFFDWVNKSMASISVSNPGEKPKGEQLPDNVKIHIDDLM